MECNPYITVFTACATTDECQGLNAVCVADPKDNFSKCLCPDGFSVSGNGDCEGN